MNELTKVRWPDGFQCPECGSQKAYYIENRQLHQCSQCRHQVSATAGTLFHSTKLPLVKWFWAIYLLASGKGSISSFPASKLLGVSRPKAHSILSKIKTAMAHRDSIYRLGNLVEFDDTYVGGKRTGKRGRGATGKRLVLVAVETRGDTVGFVVMEAVDTTSKENVRNFLAKHLNPGQTVKTDALPALNVVNETKKHEKKIHLPKRLRNGCHRCTL